MSRRIPSWVVPALPATLIGLLTLSTSGSPASSGLALCLLCGERSLADALLNVALFAPLGAALFGHYRSLRRTTFVSAALSLAIEVAQIWIPGRDSNPGDFVFNTLGAAIGAAFVLAAPYWLHPLPRVRRWIAAGVAATSIAVLATAAALLAPDLPQTRYFGQWTPRFDQLEWYHGQVLDARVGDLTVPSQPVQNDEQLRALLRAGSPIRVELVAGSRVSSLAPIFSISDDAFNSIVLLGIDRDDAVYVFRTRSSAFLLDQPDLRVTDGFAGVAAGDTLGITVRRIGDAFCFDIGPRRRCGVGFRVSDTWGILIHPASWPVWAMSLTGLAWLAVLFVPPGFFLRPGTETVTVGLLLAAVVAAVPLLTPVIPVTLPEAMAAGAGVILGTLIRHLSCPFAPPAT